MMQIHTANSASPKLKLTNISVVRVKVREIFVGMVIT